jgi:hypothetical protein
LTKKNGGKTIVLIFKPYPMIMIDNKFEFGQIVYLKTDVEQLPRQVCEIRVYGKGDIIYSIKQAESTSYHNEYELNDFVDESVLRNYGIE